MDQGALCTSRELPPLLGAAVLALCAGLPNRAVPALLCIFDAPLVPQAVCLSARHAQQLSLHQQPPHTCSPLAL